MSDEISRGGYEPRPAAGGGGGGDVTGATITATVGFVGDGSGLTNLPGGGGGGGHAARLTIANQSAIRGALEAGPKATTELIERLSEFDQIDNLIEIMQEKLTLGNTATATAAIAAATDDLARAKELAVPVDAAAAEQRIAEATRAHGLAVALTSASELVEQAAQETHSALREQAVRRDTLVRDVTRAQEAQRTAQKKLDAIVVPATLLAPKRAGRASKLG